MLVKMGVSIYSSTGCAKESVAVMKGCNNSVFLLNVKISSLTGGVKLPK